MQKTTWKSYARKLAGFTAKLYSCSEIYSENGEKLSEKRHLVKAWPPLRSISGGYYALALVGSAAGTPQRYTAHSLAWPGSGPEWLWSLPHLLLLFKQCPQLARQVFKRDQYLLEQLTDHDMHLYAGMYLILFHGLKHGNDA